MSVSAQQIAITRNAISAASEYQVWRCSQVRGELDESVIVAGWLPAGPNWTNVTNQVSLAAGINFGHDGRGWSGSFTVFGQNRNEWPDDCAIAIISRHYDGSAWSSFDVAAWGYCTGAGAQRQPKGLENEGEVKFTYAGYWAKDRTGSLTFGRPNLAQSGTVTDSSPVLATPASEAPLEYVSQDTCAGTMLIDGNADTVSVLDVIADPARPTLGDTAVAKILRVYGAQTPGIAPGGQPRFVELWCGHNLTSWGNFASAAAVPYQADTTSNVRNDAAIVSSIDTTDGKYIVHALPQSPANQRQGVEWHVSAPTGAPLRVTFDYKAGATGSIGKLLWFTTTNAGPSLGTVLQLTNAWQTYSVPLTPLSGSQTVLLRFQAGDNSTPELATDTYFEIANLRVSQGYSDLVWQRDTSGNKLLIAVDDGAGHTHVRRIAWDIAGTEDWAIPADDSIILCDDLPSFKARFDAGSRQVYQLRNFFPDWYFAPGVGKLKLCYGPYNPTLAYTDAGLTTVEEIDFAVANGGVAWRADQALTRYGVDGSGNPITIGTDTLRPEDNPHVGLWPGQYGAGYWWLDLGAYKPTTSTLPVASGAGSVLVDDPDEFPASGSAYLGTQPGAFAYTGKSDRALTGVTGVTTSQDAGALVTPQLAGAKQTGWLVDLIELRRKPGTPILLAGAVLASNLLSPSDPSTPSVVTGGKWERNPDWTLIQRWDSRGGDPAVITIALPTPLQLRHVVVVIDRMDRAGGLGQRAKLNELVVRKYAPGAGDLLGTQAGDLARAAGAILARYSGVPAAKIAVAHPAPPPIHDLAVAAGDVASHIGSVESSGLLQVWCDRYGGVTIGAPPSLPGFDASSVDWTWGAGDLAGDPQGDWAEAHACAQVQLVAKETSSWRVHAVNFPQVPLATGAILTVRDVVVNTATDALALARALFMRANLRQSLPATTGAAPWAAPYRRHVVNLPGLDAGSNWVGVNVAVEKVDVKVSAGPGGIPVTTTTFQLRELALS